jgi:hypothetical protein
MSERREPRNGAASRRPARRLQTSSPAVRGPSVAAGEARTRHLSARRLSIKVAISCIISRRSASSASSDATSDRSASWRRRAAAASRIDLRIASDRLMPEASSVRSALCTSSSSRTDTAVSHLEQPVRSRVGTPLRSPTQVGRGTPRRGRGRQVFRGCRLRRSCRRDHQILQCRP